VGFNTEQVTWVWLGMYWKIPKEERARKKEIKEMAIT
jgi:hypothetical protein